MSYILDKAGPQRVRICFDPKERFPDKAYAVATDGYLVRWVKNGTALEVEEDLFERIVMKCYPGFVQIPSFVNFRRLFREYSFHWSLVDEENLVYEFSHPLFVREKPELLANIRTKRKSLPNHEDVNEIELKAETCTTKFPPQNRTRRQKIDRRSIITTAPCVNGMSPITTENTVFYSQNQDSNISSSSSVEERLHRKKEALGDMMNNFARNEMNVSEYEQYLQNQRKLQEQQFQELQPVSPGGGAVILDSDNATRNFVCRPTYSYAIEPKYIPINFDPESCGSASENQTCNSQNDTPISVEVYPKEELQENLKSPGSESYDSYYCDPNPATAATTYVHYPTDGTYTVTATTNDANSYQQCSFSCACCKHCNGCHHNSQDYTINQLGGGDTSVSYFNL